MCRLSDIADRLEEAIEKDVISWLDVDKSTLPEPTRLYVENFLECTNLKYKIADIRLDSTCLFKIDHPTICYFHHDPKTHAHLWAGVGFKEALDNNFVLASLMSMSDLDIPFKQALRICDMIDKAFGDDVKELGE